MSTKSRMTEGPNTARPQLTDVATNLTSRLRFATGALIALILMVLLIAATMPRSSSAHSTSASSGDIAREILAKEALPDIPGHMLTAITVELPPGAVADPHRHGGFVYVYLLEGQLESRLGDGPPQSYSAGDSWIEPAGVLHAMTRNLSETMPAKFLAVIIGPEGAALRLPADGNDH